MQTVTETTQVRVKALVAVTMPAWMAERWFSLAKQGFTGKTVIHWNEGNPASLEMRYRIDGP